MGFDYSETDRQIYERELKDFLPSRIFDAHVHLLDRSCLKAGQEFPPDCFLEKFGGTFTMEQCLDWARIALPDQEFYLNHFGHPTDKSDLDASAIYTGKVSDRRRSFGMALVSPQDTLKAVRRRVVKNQLIGYKPYLAFVEGKPRADITIHDMLPPEQMQLADDMGLAITLHVPRAERLADPLNQTQMVELCQRYPNVRIIFAHIGRAYYRSNVVGYLDGLAACPNAYIDTAMVNHEGVLEYALQNFPRERILFGSDAPVACLLGKSVEINNQYAYLLADDYPIGTTIHDAAHAVTFTNFFYEQLRGIKLASERASLTRDEIDEILYGNAHRLFTEVATRNYGNTEVHT